MIWGYHRTTVSEDLHMILPSRYKKEFAMVSVTDAHLKPNPATRGPQRRFCYWNGVLLLISIPGSGGLVGTPILKHTWMKRTYRPVIGTGKILIFLVLYFCMNLKRTPGWFVEHVRSFILIPDCDAAKKTINLFAICKT